MCCLFSLLRMVVRSLPPRVVPMSVVQAVARKRKCPRPVQVRGINGAVSRYSHSFTLVCRGVIPVDSSWLIGLGRHTAESCRVSSRRRLGQILGQIRKPFRNREPAVSFLSRGQKRASSEVQNHPKWMSKQPIFLFGTRLAKKS